MIVAVCLLPCGAWAQDGLRSASLPEGGPSMALPAERDLFRVDPDFYSSRIDQRPLPTVLPSLVLLPYWYFPSVVDVHQYETRADRDGMRGVAPPRDASRQGPPPADQSPAPSVTLPPLAPGVPKTFYVIPGCYAGDVPPRIEWLPRGCDRSRMRLVGP